MANRPRPSVGYRTSALTPSCAISFTRSCGSWPPGWCWNPSPTLCGGNDGALSPKRADSALDHRSGGSITWESAEMISSWLVAVSGLMATLMPLSLLQRAAQIADSHPLHIVERELDDGHVLRDNGTCARHLDPNYGFTGHELDAQRVLARGEADIEVEEHRLAGGRDGLIDVRRHVALVPKSANAFGDFLERRDDHGMGHHPESLG